MLTEFLLTAPQDGLYRRARMHDIRLFCLPYDPSVAGAQNGIACLHITSSRPSSMRYDDVLFAGPRGLASSAGARATSNIYYAQVDPCVCRRREPCARIYPRRREYVPRRRLRPFCRPFAVCICLELGNACEWLSALCFSCAPTHHAADCRARKGRELQSNFVYTILHIRCVCVFIFSSIDLNLSSLLCSLLGRRLSLVGNPAPPVLAHKVTKARDGTAGVPAHPRNTPCWHGPRPVPARATVPAQGCAVLAQGLPARAADRAITLAAPARGAAMPARTGGVPAWAGVPARCRACAGTLPVLARGEVCAGTPRAGTTGACAGTLGCAGTPC
jgi:hypothetical protein